MLLTLAVSNGWETHHVDFNSAYLNAELNEEIYMKIPNGHKASESENVFRLKKAIYRLEQAGRKWYLLLRKNLLSQEWQECKKDNCVFQRKNRGLKEILAVYVDDVLIIAENTTAISTIKVELASAFKIKDLGKLDYILGMRISQNRKQKLAMIDQEGLTKHTIAQYSQRTDQKSKLPMQP